MTGSIIRADNSGLGTLAREFYDNGLIDRALIVSNGVYKSFPERFPNGRVSDLNEEDVAWLMEGVDTLLFFETPFIWSIIPRARAKGIKTIIMPMHECLHDPVPYQPDVWICPSSLEMDLDIEPKVRINVPASNRINWRLRKKANVFVHNAGHGGLKERNGTSELIAAMKFVKSDIKLIIRSQMYQYKVDDSRIEVRYENHKDYWKIWDEGDVFIFPERFNGLSLPIQEAVSSGMAVIATDRKPFNEWLPRELLITPSFFKDERVCTRNVEVAFLKPEAIAEKIDELAGQNIEKYSLFGKQWAEENSWGKLKAQYQALCEK